MIGALRFNSFVYFIFSGSEDACDRGGHVWYLLAPSSFIHTCARFLSRGHAHGRHSDPHESVHLLSLARHVKQFRQSNHLWFY